MLSRLVQSLFIYFTKSKECVAALIDLYKNNVTVSCTQNKKLVTEGEMGIKNESTLVFRFECVLDRD